MQRQRAQVSLVHRLPIYGPPIGIHVTHRVLAFPLFGHLLGMAIATTKRKEPALIRRAALNAFATAVVQVLVAGAMIGMQFPRVQVASPGVRNAPVARGRRPCNSQLEGAHRRAEQAAMSAAA